MPRAAVLRRAAAGLVAATGLALGAASTAAAAPRPTLASAPDAHRLEVRLLGIRDGRVRLTLATAGATDYDVRITVRDAGATVATGRLATAGPRRRTVSLTVRRGVSVGGRLTVDVTAMRHSPVAQTTSYTSS